MLYSSPLLLLVSLLVCSVNSFVVAPATARTSSLHLWGASGDGAKEKRPKGAMPQITKIESSEDYLNFLAQDERLCVIKFYASWCKSCQKFGVKYGRLALQEGDLFDDQGNLVQTGNVRFAAIEFGANARLCKSLDIKRLPNVHMYKGSVGQLSAFPCGPSKFALLEEKVFRFLTLSDDELKLQRTLEEGSDLADSIVTELQRENAATKKEASSEKETSPY